MKIRGFQKCKAYNLVIIENEYIDTVISGLPINFDSFFNKMGRTYFGELLIYIYVISCAFSPNLDLIVNPTYHSSIFEC